MKRLVCLFAVLALAGCAQIKGLLGASPDPRPAANYEDVRYFVQKDPDPVDAPRGAVAVARAEGLVADYGSKSGLDAFFAPVVTAVAAVNPIYGFALTGLLGLAGIWIKRRQDKTVAAVDQHATLLDSVTPESAEFAAKALAKPVVA